MNRFMPLIISAGLLGALLCAAPQTKGSREVIQETRTTTDSGTTKITTDTLFGKVEAYDTGKSIKVSTPGKSEGSRTIDLTGSNLTANVNFTGKLGDWVKVVETTDNNGHKNVTIQPSNGQ
jgi:hypothetical protein